MQAFTVSLTCDTISAQILIQAPRGTRFTFYTRLPRSSYICMLPIWCACPIHIYNNKKRKKRRHFVFEMYCAHRSFIFFKQLLFCMILHRLPRALPQHHFLVGGRGEGMESWAFTFSLSSRVLAHLASCCLLRFNGSSVQKCIKSTSPYFLLPTSR